jgi:hypothetical protein
MRLGTAPDDPTNSLYAIVEKRPVPVRRVSSGACAGRGSAPSRSPMATVRRSHASLPDPFPSWLAIRRAYPLVCGASQTAHRQRRASAVRRSSPDREKLCAGYAATSTLQCAPAEKVIESRRVMMLTTCCQQVVRPLFFRLALPRKKRENPKRSEFPVPALDQCGDNTYISGSAGWTGRQRNL